MEHLHEIFEHSVLFMLLFARVGAMFVFFPFFSHMQIPVVIKTALSIVISFFLLDISSVKSLEQGIVLAICMEVLLGLCAGIFLQLTFTILHMAGEFISFSMGFTMANILDPNSGAQTPIVASIVYLIALTCFLEYDGHHLVLLFLSNSINHIELGGFLLNENIFLSVLKSLKDLYLISLCLAFPVIGICFLADFIFGMLMKTMPQFNLLVVGYPIKISIAFAVVTSILSVMMYYFKELVMGMFMNLNNLFF